MIASFLPALLAIITMPQGPALQPGYGRAPEPYGPPAPPHIDPNTLSRSDWVDPRAVDWSRFKL